MGSRNRYDAYFGKTPAAIIRRKARQLVRTNAGRAEEAADYEQELALRLWVASKRYDPTLSTPAAYTQSVVANVSATIVEARQAKKRCAPTRPPPPDDDEVLNDAEVIDLSDFRAAERERHHASEMSYDVATAMADLPTRQRDLCRRLMHGTISQVSKDTGWSRSWMYREIAKVRVRFERAGVPAHLPDTSARLPVCTARRKA